MKSSTGAAPTRARATTNMICLSMIVKNEAHVIERCLRSVAPIVDYFVIIDTGSTDGTQTVIRKIAKRLKLKGKILSREWVDFGTNRTEAFVLAREYLKQLKLDLTQIHALVVDADDTIRVSDPVTFQASLRKNIDAYDMRIDDNGFEYVRPQLTKMSLPFRYVAPLHEYLMCDVPYQKEFIEGIAYVRIGGGGRHKDPNKTQTEIDIFKRALEKNPTDARSAFYLGQTYYYAWRVEEAIEAYTKASTLWGWTEERFIAHFHLGELEHSQKNWAKAQDHYLKAYAQNPRRAEPLERIAKYYRESGEQGWADLAYLFSRQGIDIVADPNGFLVDKSVHEYKCLDEFSIAAYYSGHYEESRNASQKLLSRDVPKEHIDRIRGNLEYSINALKKRKPTK